MSEVADFIVNEVNEHYRKTKNLKALAAKAGVFYCNLNSWRKGKSVPTLENAEKILDALGWEIVIRKKFN